MKEMTYIANRIKEILDKGAIDGFDYVIVSYGPHPCAYIRIPEGHPFYDKDYDDVALDVHGGLTYSGNLSHLDGVEPGFYLGWDYAHIGDYVGYYDSNDKKWTTEEILEEVKGAIAQVRLLND